MSDFLVQKIPWQTIDMKNRVSRAEEAIKREKEIGDNNDISLNKACAEMESLFIYQLFKEMRASIPKSGFISGGKGEDVYQSMLDSELAKELSKRSSLGLASILQSQLKGTGRKEITEKP